MASETNSTQSPAHQAFTFTSLILPTLAALVAYQLVQCIHAAFFHPLAGIPGPFLARFSRLWIFQQITGLKRCFAIHEAFKTYDSDIIRIAPNLIAFQDANAMAKLYGKTAIKAPLYRGIVFNETNHAMTRESAEEHIMVKKLTTSPYAPNAILQWDDEIREYTHDYLKDLYQRGDNGKQPVDIMYATRHLALDIVATVALSERLYIVRDHPDHWIPHALDGILNQTGIRTTLYPFLAKAVESIPAKAVKELFACEKNLAAYSRALLNKAKRDLKESGAEGVQKQTLLTSMLTTPMSNGKILDDDNIVAELVGHLFAGTDTVSTTIGYTVYELARQPRVVARLFDEVKSLSDDPLDVPSLKTINSLPYLNAVVREALRIYAAAPSSLPRIVPAGGAIICGRYIPAGTEVCAQAWTSHRVKEAFGKDADEFVPERWENETEEMRQHFMPYGLLGSPRQCTGHNLATIQLKLNLAVLVRNFTFRPAEETNDASMKMLDTFLIGPVSHQIKMYLEPRQALH